MKLLLGVVLLASLVYGQLSSGVESADLKSAGKVARDKVGKGTKLAGKELWGAATIARVASQRVGKGNWRGGGVSSAGGSALWRAGAGGGDSGLDAALSAGSDDVWAVAVGSIAAAEDGANAKTGLGKRVEAAIGVLDAGKSSTLEQRISALLVVAAGAQAGVEGAAKAAERASTDVLARVLSESSSDVESAAFAAQAAVQLKRATGGAVDVDEDVVHALASTLSGAVGAALRSAKEGSNFWRAGVILSGLDAIEEGVVRPLVVRPASKEGELAVEVSTVFGDEVPDVKVSVVGGDVRAGDLRKESGKVFGVDAGSSKGVAKAELRISAGKGFASYSKASVTLVVPSAAELVSSAASLTSDGGANERRTSGSSSTLAARSNDVLTVFFTAALPDDAKPWVIIRNTGTTSSSSDEPDSLLLAPKRRGAEFVATLALSSRPRFLSSSTLEASILLAGPTVQTPTETKVVTLTNVAPLPPIEPPQDILYTRPLLDESDRTLTPLRELHHTFRSPERQVPAFISTVVASAILAILAAAAIFGRSIVASAEPVSLPAMAILFFVALALVLAVDSLYFFQTYVKTAFDALLAKAVLTTVAVFTGHATLKQLVK